MILIKNNPHWPDHVDFNCPHCKGAILDSSDYDFDGPNEDSEKFSCPHCEEEFTAFVKITWEYNVSKISNGDKL